jgi:NTP pyrophosphatase (non-canonical NTP hydrolase)
MINGGKRMLCDACKQADRPVTDAASTPPFRKNMSYAEVELKIIRWSEARKIIPNSTPETQLLKAVSELGELADATIKEDREGIVDGVGDVMVCLVNFCALQDIDLVTCMKSAYAEIKDRKGTLMPNGVFVKSE